MSYYDNVKDNVRDGGSTEDDDKSSNASFDTLKEAAEETSEQEDEEEKGDNTPIEVLEEGGLEERPAGSSNQQKTQDRSAQRSQSQGENTGSGQGSGNPLTQSSDNSGLEQKLDRIIEQNEKMIEILESFGS